MHDRLAYKLCVSRLLISAVAFAAGLFFLGGLDLAFTGTIFVPGPGGIETKRLAAGIAMMALAGPVLATQLAYIARPPVMIAAGREGISFATGFRYRQTFIPWEHVGEIRLFTGHHPLSFLGIGSGLVVCFKPSANLPPIVAVSAGLSFYDNSVHASGTYAGPEIFKAKQEIARLRPPQ